MKLCRNCFRQIGDNSECPYCGYDEREDADKYPLALKPETVLNGRYQLGRVLGQGGFGVTYVALDTQTRSRVAIKEYLPAEFAYREPGSKELLLHSGDVQESFSYGKQQFLHEAGTLAELVGNEHIIRIESYFEENGTAYFAMEYVEGSTLKAVLEENGAPLRVDEINRILLPVMEALQWVHSKGIVHRDISPDNIIIRKDGISKLIDFGAARYSTGEKSKSLDVILKHGFAPKEQYARRGRQGPYTDVYAMAATYYYALTGKVPPDAVDRMEEDKIVLPSKLGAKIRPDTEKALMKALAVSAEERFQSMAAFYSALLESMPNPFAPEAAEESDRDRKKRQAEEKKQEKQEQKAANAKNGQGKRRMAAATAALLLTAVLVFVGVKTASPMLQYQKAVEQLKQGNYGQAAAILETLGNYRDSDKLLSEARQEIDYLKAEELLAAGNYEEASAAFDALDGYRDSSDRAAEARDAAEEAGRGMVYAEAVTKMGEGNIEEAYALFQTIRGYRDVDQLLSENRELISAERRIAIRTPGSIVALGNYEQDNNMENGAEPIEWIVLDVQEGKTLLISRYALDCKKLHDYDTGSLTWEMCTLRAWLNSDFLNTAFSAEEQQAILVTEVDNGKNQGYPGYHRVTGGKNTEDRLFLLSFAEAKQYFPSDESQRPKTGNEYDVYNAVDYLPTATCQSTAYARAHGANAGLALWWLRSPGENQKCAMFVAGNGAAGYKVPYYIPDGTVRPALWVENDAEIF